MSALVRSELLKLRTTRTFWGLVPAPLAVVLVIVALVSIFDKFHGSDADVLKSMLGVCALVQIFAMLLGILSVTNEYRHGTMTPTALIVPDRVRLGLSKLAAMLLAGLIYGLVSCLLVSVITLLIVHARGIPTGGSFSHAVALIVGGTIATALYAVVGVGIGAIIRNQVGAIVGSLIYLLLVETLLGAIPGLDDIVPVYGLGNVGNALSGTATDSNALAQVPGGLVLAAWAVVLVVIGLAAMRERDISG